MIFGKNACLTKTEGPSNEIYMYFKQEVLFPGLFISNPERPTFNRINELF